MAITLNLHQLLLFFLFILSPFFFHHTNKQLVVADERLIERTCRDTEAPALCVQCIKSNQEGEKANTRADIAAIAITCLSTHAETLVKNMSSFTSQYSSDKVFVSICQNCGKGYSRAIKTLSQANANLKNGDYDNANHLVIFALSDEFVQSCAGNLRNYSATRVGPHVFYEIRVYEQLSGTAMTIIDRLLSHHTP